ncbi:hypothetical protein IQ07DRAFT_593692 [Pyrenochaeta sp. DS3sAY3a]|nr:hypothetical protein IQ07DRAFT_593692 [Pyrenochaeta sp. DS3sAY3a]
MLRAACRKNQQEMDSFVSIVLEVFSELNKSSTGSSINVLQLFQTLFMDLTHQQISIAIDFQPVLSPPLRPLQRGHRQ